MRLTAVNEATYTLGDSAGFSIFFGALMRHLRGLTIALCLPLFLGLFGCIHLAQPENAPTNRNVDVVAIPLVMVPPGEFLMGGTETAEALALAYPSSGKTPDYFADEYPRHRVRITKAFLLGKFEVTVAQFRQFTVETGYKTEAESDGTGGWGCNASTGRCEGRQVQYSWHNPGYPLLDAQPVVNVSYNDALAFCQWLSKKEGKHYRLPTEAEWEYANRAGTQTRYANSDDPAQLPSFARAIDLSRHGEFGHIQEIIIKPDDPTAFPIAVGRLAPNAFGLHDMHGNVWEWVADWYGPTYYSESPVDDPQGPRSGELRVRRGGGWNSFPIWLRSSFRNWNTPSSRCVNLGFRVARDL
ncbi:formylglycine-generating enzyme family protein [Accumulibacter sp.]|uniref:formylglycine-generating enzyme family protein n=1 Tax=Accumulibacter sp. TaxID=2053492 RepID=UPI00258040EB|nr:formylglycine-generating enzyme family protein [Accumulibacter sp.]